MLITILRRWLLALASIPCSALAIIGGQGIDPDTPNSQWAGVGSVITPNGSYSGTLIAPGYVLTAAHVVGSFPAASISFQLNAGTSFQIAASEIFVNPIYGTDTTNNIQHGDLAIIRLSSQAPATVPYYPLYGSAIAVGNSLELVGYGVGGDGINGATVPANPAVKRTALDPTVQTLNNRNNVADTYVFYFSPPPATGTGTVGSGDSGGPAFIFANGQWQLAGVNTFAAVFSAGQSPGTYGTGGGGMMVAPYSAWIQSVMAPPADMAAYVSGSPVLRYGLARLLALYCKAPGDPGATTPSIEYQWSGAPSGTSAQDFRAYSCQFKETSSTGFRPELTTYGLAGKTALIYHSVGQTLALGGSVIGVTPIVRDSNVGPDSIPYLSFVDETGCAAPANLAGTDSVTGFPLYNCGLSQIHRPDIGVSDVQPSLFTGVNLPVLAAPYAGYSIAPGGLPTDSKIKVQPVFAQGFGVALTKKLHDGLIGGVAVTNLTHQQVSGLLSGAYDNWSQLGGPNAPITLITRTKGSGTKAFFNAAFLENPCGASVAPIDPTSTGPTGTLTVHEWDATGDLRNDLIAVDNAGGAGVAIIGLDSNSGNGLDASPGWTYATIDGRSVYVSNVALDVADGTADHILEDQIINGNWKYFSEATLQYRAGNGGPPVDLAGSTRNFADMIAAYASDPIVTRQVPGVVSLPAWSNNFPNPRVVSGGVSNFTRGGNTCAPGIFTVSESRSSAPVV
jgi:hypothetical protein